LGKGKGVGKGSTGKRGGRVVEDRIGALGERRHSPELHFGKLLEVLRGEIEMKKTLFGRGENKQAVRRIHPTRRTSTEGDA